MEKTRRSSKRYAVIMAGGRGERFWPLSRQKRPKQLLRLLGRGSFLQQAVRRARPLVPSQNIYVITNAAQAPETRRQLPELPRANIISEPCGRDTCAAVTLAAALVRAKDPEGVCAVLPADHLIPEEKKFRRVLSDAYTLAAGTDAILTIGIQPTEPATGYGYIRLGKEISSANLCGRELETVFRKAERFVEKPDLKTALAYLRSGKYRWNAGMFIWSAAALLAGLRKHRPEMAAFCERWTEAIRAGRLRAALEVDYPGIEKISIDYALMEKADNVISAEGDFAWDDLGSWTALGRRLPADEAGNAARAWFVGLDASGNIVFDGRSGRRGVVAALGVKDCILVLTDDATLIASKKEAQRLKELVKLLGQDRKLRRFV